MALLNFSVMLQQLPHLGGCCLKVPGSVAIMEAD
jgi:hypothetical protein